MYKLTLRAIAAALRNILISNENLPPHGPGNAITQSYRLVGPRVNPCHPAPTAPAGRPATL